MGYLAVAFVNKKANGKKRENMKPKQAYKTLSLALLPCCCCKCSCRVVVALAAWPRLIVANGRDVAAAREFPAKSPLHWRPTEHSPEGHNYNYKYRYRYRYRYWYRDTDGDR